MASSSDRNIPSIRRTEPDSDYDEEDISPRTTRAPAKRNRSPDLRPSLLHPSSASIASSNRPRTQPHQPSPGPSDRPSKESPFQSSIRFFQTGGTGRLEPPRARSVPAWVRIREDASADEKTGGSHPPESAGGAGPSVGDHSSEFEPPQPGRKSRWERFARPAAYPQVSRLEEKLVDEEWLCENFGDLSGPWGPETRGMQRPAKKKKTLQARCYRQLLYNPLVPLIIRMVVFGFSLVALALGASIRHYAERDKRVPNGPSAYMAITVDAVALVYLIYVSYDEFRGKPLGIRSPYSKMRLILLDLFFIIFDSANLSLAFEALSDVREACEEGDINRHFSPMSLPICDRQKALASVLLVALIAWILNFSLSTFR
ncbi:hypothetical protein KEM56_005429 [Ascosphaera pollenicola]|nr:hypothetical protein KEM56_005429 [Ascosphaera pollenicola]